MLPRSQSSAGKRRGPRRRQYFFRVFPDVALAENSVAGNKQFRARAHNIAHSFHGNATIDFNSESQPEGFADFYERLDLV